MNNFSQFIKKSKGLLIITLVSGLLSEIYFSVTGKSDSSNWDLFLYIFLPTFLPGVLYSVITFSKKKKKQVKL
jgi:hypothetical protein